MIANSALLSALVLVVLCLLLLDQLSFLAPFGALIVGRYGWLLGSLLIITFVDLFALFYAISRRIFLKDTGRKLAHVERQLLTPDTIARDLSDRLSDGS